MDSLELGGLALEMQNRRCRNGVGVTSRTHDIVKQGLMIGSRKVPCSYRTT